MGSKVVFVLLFLLVFTSSDGGRLYYAHMCNAALQIIVLACTSC